MTAVNAIINVDINTAQAQAELQRLSAQVNAFNRTLNTTTAAAGRMAADFNSKAVGKAFTAQMIPVVSSVDQFSNALEKNKLTLGEYSRYAASQLPGMSRMFRREFDTMNRVAESRVKQMQSQYMALGKTAQGVQLAMQMTPTGLGKGYATDMALATQRAQIFNKVVDNGATKMLNWGKNTQWAGRQLMVGFSLPLAALGAVAAKTFIELDKTATAFKRVYGDLNTTTASMETNLQAMKDLGAEYTKYGIAVKDTLALSARVAATGAQNQDLLAMTEETLRLATLGQMDYNEALNATISMQTAFKISSEDLGSTVDYLNAVENQTVLTIQDMAAAIPRVAPVIKGLGGDVKDLAAMLTAMREGGVTAEQGANALKSGLASLINPTARAQAALQRLNIDMKAIVTQNRGDLLGTVQAFGKALAVVDEFSQQQALEQIFGKYQYARMGALFKNIANDAGQAAKAIDLAGKSTEELAMLSERELGRVEDSTS
jgi:TP901 family phage tail tape measure protein